MIPNGDNNEESLKNLLASIGIRDFSLLRRSK
jgi:hypothetical protein